MQNNYARYVRGLSIATTILSACGVALWLLCIAATVFGGAVLTSPDTLAWLGEHSSSGHTMYEQHGAEAVMGVFGLTIGVAVFALLVPMALSGVSLAAGILGMRHFDNPDKYGTLFAWAIAGAVSSFLAGGVVVTVLLIISAVYLSKLRNNPYVAQQAYGQQFVQPGAGVSFDQANQAYNPNYGPTGQGYGAPFVQPTAQPGSAPQQPPYAGQASAQAVWQQGGAPSYGGAAPVPPAPNVAAWPQGQPAAQPQGYPRQPVQAGAWTQGQPAQPSATSAPQSQVQQPASDPQTAPQVETQVLSQAPQGQIPQPPVSQTALQTEVQAAPQVGLQSDAQVPADGSQQTPNAAALQTGVQEPPSTPASDQADEAASDAAEKK